MRPAPGRIATDPGSQRRLAELEQRRTSTPGAAPTPSSRLTRLPLGEVVERVAQPLAGAMTFFPLSLDL